jgi:XTP/dITP diphosphohydrolase
MTVAFPERLVLATMNEHKVRELLRICAGWPVRWITNREVSWPAAEEDGTTYLENALLKAHAAAAVVGEPALADDSGIEVDALGGEPGLWSARFAGPEPTDGDNLRLLIDRVRETEPERRTARYRCAAACVWPDGREMWAEDACEGSLILEPRGTEGFGYDPIFVPSSPGDGRTMAQLSPGEKDAVSHRGKAFRALGRLLEGS